MKITKRIYLMNDRVVPMSVSTKTLSNVIAKLQPQTGAYVEIEVPEDKVPFIKIWENNMVFVDWADQ